MDTAAAILHAVADRFLVNIQTDVVHIFHGGASLVVSESAGSLSSAFLHQALLHRLIHSNNPPTTPSFTSHNPIWRLSGFATGQMGVSADFTPAYFRRPPNCHHVGLIRRDTRSPDPLSAALFAFGKNAVLSVGHRSCSFSNSL